MHTFKFQKSPALANVGCVGIGITTPLFIGIGITTPLFIATREVLRWESISRDQALIFSVTKTYITSRLSNLYLTDNAGIKTENLNTVNISYSVSIGDLCNSVLFATRLNL